MPMFKIKFFTFATCLTLSGVVLPALALEFKTSFNNSKSSPDRSAPNLNKTRPEFARPDLPTPTPSITPSINPLPSPVSSPTISPSSELTSTPAVSSPVVPTASPNLLPSGGTGAQGFGDRPITPTINTLPGTNRPEFQVPDLVRPPSSSPSPSPSPT